eukprot:4204499-Pyramimonas_sp.AAC.1
MRPRQRNPSPRRRWFRAFPLPTPFIPFGEGFTPPHTPSPGPGRGRPRAARAPKMARRGSESASESRRWPPGWPKIAQDASK